MAITKKIENDQIEIVGEFKALQIRQAEIILEDGKELTRAFHRRVLHCVTSTNDGDKWTHTDTNISSETSEVQAIAAAVWTDAVKEKKKTANEAAGLPV